MAVSLTVGQLEERVGVDIGTRADSLLATVRARVDRYTPHAPVAVQNEAAIIFAAWLWQAGAQARQVFPADGEGRPPINVSRAFLLSGAQGLLSPWRVPRAGASTS